MKLNIERRAFVSTNFGEGRLDEKYRGTTGSINVRNRATRVPIDHFRDVPFDRITLLDYRLYRIEELSTEMENKSENVARKQRYAFNRTFRIIQ